VHLVGGGERQQERAPQQREAGTVLPCSVDVDPSALLPRQQVLARVLIVCGLALICGPLFCCMVCMVYGYLWGVCAVTKGAGVVVLYL